MDCDAARQSVSDAIDRGIPLEDDVADHVAHCPACGRWQEAAHRLRRATMRPVAATETNPIEVSRLPERFVLHRWLRFALVWVAIILIVGNVVTMFAVGEGSAIHLERHQAAFDVALGLAFLFVAWRPDRAYGMVPFAVAFMVALSVSAIIDLVNGASTVFRESAHLVELVGLAVLWWLGLAVGPGRSRRRVLTGRGEKSQSPG